MIYSINNIAKLYSNIYVFNSLHQTQKYHSMKRNPKKNKRDNNDEFSYETQKKKKKTHTPLTDSGSATALCIDLGRDNTARDHVRSH